MEKLKLSVITSTYNSGASLGQTIESILSQSYRPLEYIIIDGNSTDNTLQIIEEAKGKLAEAGIYFNYISEKDSGIYNAWNKGLNLASGNWISFLGSDDMYVPNAIQKYASAIQQDQNIDFVCAKTKMMSKGKLVREFGEDFCWQTFKKEMKILHAGSFMASAYFKKFGKFDESYRITADYEMLLRKGQSIKVKFIDEFLVIMGADGISSSEIAPAFLEAKRARIENGARNKLFAEIDYYWLRFKIFLKTIINGN